MGERQYIEHDTILNFGKYKGIIVSDVVETDPGYIRWLIEKGIVTASEDLEVEV